jgi:hypothetical protein
MNEDEAKTKWCPMVRLIDGQPPGGAATNRAYQEFGTEHALSNRCIGSACMMWRWDSSPNPNHTPFMAQFPPQAEPPYVKSSVHGHCGLAHG